MITHLAFIGPEIAVAELRPPAMGDPSPPLVVLNLGADLALHLSVEMAESIADALVGAVADAADVVTMAGGPVPYVPMWHPV